MVVTRSQTAATASSLLALNSAGDANKLPKVSRCGRLVERNSRRWSSPSPPNSIHRSDSQQFKKILSNNNFDDIRSVTSKTTTRARSSSFDSSITSSTKSSRSSSNSSTVSSSSSDSHSSTCTTTTSVIKNMAKLEISNNNSSFSSISTSSSQESNRLPQAGDISVYKSTKSGDFLCLHGYTYQIDRRMKNKIKWKCKESRNKIRCGTKIYTTENVGTDRVSAYKYLGSNNVFHSHDEDNDQSKVEIFQSELKDIGANNRTVPTSKIINQLATSMKLTDTQLGLIPRHAALYQRVYRIRSKTVPPIPKSVIFDIPVAFSTTSSDEKFIFFDHLYCKQTKRIIAFASPMQLKKLFTSKLICVDGTFSICPRKHKQLLIIQSIDQQKYEAIPVLYVLLNDKEAHTYKLLFRALKSTATEMKMKFEPDKIISDFESGFISTVKKELPNTTHQGCLFHLYQRLTKKLKKFGLWAYYKTNDELHLFIKKVMAIVLLKPTVMDNAYELLVKQYLYLKKLKQFTVQLTKFMLYFQKQWMKSSIRTMISFYEVYFKTNNWSESYNSVLRRRAQQSHLSIWVLIDLLITEETAVRMKHFQSLNGKTKSINKTIRDGVIGINQKIIELNQKLEVNEIELDDCLISLSILVGVKYDKWRKQRNKNKKRKKDDIDDDPDD